MNLIRSLSIAGLCVLWPLVAQDEEPAPAPVMEEVPPKETAAENAPAVEAAAPEEGVAKEEGAAAQGDAKEAVPQDAPDAPAKEANAEAAEVAPAQTVEDNAQAPAKEAAAGELPLVPAPAKDLPAAGQDGEGKGEIVIEPLRIEGPNWPEVPEALRLRAEAIVARLAGDEFNQRMDARDDLRALGIEAMPVLIENLYHPHGLARTSCATILGEWRATEAIKYLIEAFYSALPEQGQAATYQRTFIRALADALERTTGQFFMEVEARSPLVQDALRKYIDWYNANIDRLPPQLGEPQLEPLDPQYLEKLKILRALVLEKRGWRRPPLAVAHAIGHESVVEGEVYKVERPADKQFLERWPVIDKSTENNFFRQTDQQWANELVKEWRYLK